MGNNPMQQNTLDPQAVNLAKAIRQVESGNNPTAQGASGEFGAYQFTPDTWASASQQYLGQNVPLQQATPEQQNEVAYKRIKAWKDAGYNVGQIASMWNAGESHPDAYQQNYQGVNAKGVAYNTPAYAQKVAETYQSIKNGNVADQYAPPPEKQPFTPASPVQTQTQQQPTQDLSTVGGRANYALTQGANQFIPGVTSDLQQRGQQISQAAGELGQGVSTGNFGQAVSGGLQTLGGLAGGVTDVLGRAADVIPGVLPLEHAAGNAIQGLVQTPAGKSISNAVQTWAQNNPELAKDAGAVLNIASAIPALKAVGSVGHLITSLGDKTFSKALTKQAADELVRAGGINKTATNLARKGAIDEIISNPEKYLPDVVQSGEGTLRYNPQTALGNVQGDINGLMQQKAAALATQPTLYNAKNIGRFIAGDTAGTTKQITAKPIQNALDQLEQHLIKSNAPEAEVAQIQALKDKFANEGLDVGQIDQLAQLHGSNLSGFGLTGEVSGITKQAAENTRKQLKDIVGALDQTGTARQLDKQISKKIAAADYLKMIGKGAGKRAQTTIDTGVLARLRRLAADLVPTTHYAAHVKPGPKIAVERLASLRQKPLQPLVSLGRRLALSKTAQTASNQLPNQ